MIEAFKPRYLNKEQSTRLYQDALVQLEAKLIQARVNLLLAQDAHAQILSQMKALEAERAQ